MIIETNGKISENSYGLIKKVNNIWHIYSQVDKNGKVKEEDLILKIENKNEYAKLGRESYRLLGLKDGSSRVIRFCDLHRHSDNSLQDGMTKISTMVKLTEYSGALTDHGNMYGYFEYYNSMIKAGKKPIIGMEGYMVDLDGELKKNHIILLAKNQQGYNNLLKIASESYEHFYRKPQITWDMLEKYNDGIICLSACLGGLLPRTILNGDMEKAEEVAIKFIEIFGENYYIELQRHGIKNEASVNLRLLQIAKKYNIKCVATTDSHYPTKDDVKAHEILLCLQTGKTLEDTNRLKYDGTGYFLHNSEDMEELFSDLPELLDNTLEIEEKCNVFIKQGDINLPNYSYPEPFTSAEEYMKHLALEGFKNRFKDTDKINDKTYVERFNYEYEMIKEMGFSSYFIIVWDFLNYAREHNIYIGPGRGSAAGSLIAYCLGITNLDPIRYNLLFERFLNPERVSMPDIDSDIEDIGRDKIIHYLINKYGAKNVCKIITFGTFAAKQSIKDVARILNYPATYANKITKLIPSKPDMTIEKALKESPSFTVLYDEDEDAKRIIDIAKNIEGGKRHSSIHACGIVIGPKEISEFIPTSIEKDLDGNKDYCSQLVMSEIEPLSLIKMDLLGLKNMTVIHETSDEIIRIYGEENILKEIGSTKNKFSYEDIPMNDRKTYELLSRGITGGVFQLESEGMTKTLQQLFYDVKNIPDENLEELFERIIAAVALYRPGPMDYIPDYILGMKDKNNIHYDCNEEKEILEKTYGVMVYQEQLMEIAQKLAGYTLGRADILRKACGKKKIDIMNAEKEVFIYGNKKDFESGKDKNYVPGCVGNGITEKAALEVWDKMVKFASYAFNRSHAACYAYIAYITAYMSCHWPVQFYTAMLNAFINNSNKTKTYLSQIAQRNIQLLLPDINKSNYSYSSDKNNIRIGLRGISGIDKQAKLIIKERSENGEYKNCQEMFKRLIDADIKVNKKTYEGLIFSGALNSFSNNKRQLVEYFEILNKSISKKNKITKGQISFLPEEAMIIDMPIVNSDYPKNILSTNEYNVLGTYISYHPLDEVIKQMAGNQKFISVDDLYGLKEEMYDISTIGVIKEVKTLFTKKKKEEMCSFKIESKFSSIKAVMFPKQYKFYKNIIEEGKIFKIFGKINIDDLNSEAQFIAEKIENVLIITDKKSDLSPVVINIENKEQQTKVIDLINQNKGDRLVILKVGIKQYPLNIRACNNIDKIIENNL